MTQHATRLPETGTTAVEPAASAPAGTTRRRVLATTGVVAAAAAVTAACGGSSSSSSPSTPATSGSTPATSDPATPPAAAGGTATADVPVGGGVILTDRKIVITQPTAGTFKGFTAVCTHQGCVVASVSDGRINCACHGSAFSAADGSVLNGPATSALAPVDVTVSGDQITVA